MELENATFTVEMGLTGGENGYNFITGKSALVAVLILRIGGIIGKGEWDVCGSLGGGRKRARDACSDRGRI